MITRVLQSLEYGMQYVLHHTHILVALLLLIVLPILFINSGEQFLEAGRANQERLQKDRVGIIHDSFVSILSATNADRDVMQSEVESLTELNPDIELFVIQQRVGNQLQNIVSSDPEILAATSTLSDMHRNAAIRFDESLIFETAEEGERFWYGYRASEVNGTTYFIGTVVSLGAVDSALSSREWSAYWSLALVYLFILALAYWHIRMTNYQALYLKAKEKNESKDTFLNMVAHELRTPLTAIRGYASMQLETSDPEKRTEYAGKVKDSSERMLGLVNDLLDVARIQSGKLAVIPEQTPLIEIAAQVTRELELLARQHSLQLTYHLPEQVYVYADPERLHQVIVNIVSNAIKYTKQGSISISAQSKRKTVEIRIADTGTGMGSEDQQKLFSPFFRVENADTAAVTGTGLGMWITKQLVKQMNGTIGVESIKGVGTHVVVTLPRADVTK